MWQSSDTTGNLRIGTDGDDFVGCDFARQRYYYAKPAPEKDAFIPCRHAMVNLFFRWAIANDMLLLHAAAVGWKGKGVLIVGRGGSGKSTFSVTCLTEGLDFVSDDYTLLSASGERKAMPLYTVVALNPDMQRRLPQLGTPLLKEDGSVEGGKPQFQIPGDRYSQALSIHAVILPAVTGQEEPSIRPVAPGRALTQVIHSTITQTESRRDPALVQKMASRLRDLPVYQMDMSTDLTKNPAFLRRFIEKEF